ncbi:hypothetical protein EEB19_14295 [Gordonia sp. OPL2]|nr:hypothetical protein EEB19_14295 [Gordonia sp. OPL2]
MTLASSLLRDRVTLASSLLRDRVTLASSLRLPAIPEERSASGVSRRVALLVAGPHESHVRATESGLSTCRLSEVILMRTRRERIQQHDDPTER